MYIHIYTRKVESLTAARQQTMARGTEPGDSVRVVNALLTQLDQIRRLKNVIVLTTSNITEAIDLAGQSQILTSLPLFSKWRKMWI